MKQFNELTEEEKAELEKTLKERASKEGRDLLEDVICAYRPMPGCQCGCMKNVGGSRKV